MKIRIGTVPSIDTCNKSTKAVRILLIVILLLAGTVRFVYLAQLQSNPLAFFVVEREDFDQCRFMELAKEFIRGNWLGSEVTRYSPAYSYLVAVLYKIFPQTVNTIFVFQILLGLAAVYVFYKTAGLLFNNIKVGLVAAFVAALYSPFIFYECCVLRASIIAYANLVGFYFLLKAVRKDKPAHFFTAGVLIGVSMILRPNILPVFIIPCMFITGRKSCRYRALYALLFISGLILIILPLSIRNRMLGRNVLISYQGPSSFWIGNTYNSTGINFPLRGVRDNELVREAQGDIGKTFKILLREIKNHPREYRSLYGRKIKMFLNGYEIPANLNYDLFRLKHNVLKLSFLNFAIVCPLAILGMFLAGRKYHGGSLLYMFLLVLSFSTIAFHIQGRYRIPAVTFFIIFASYGLYWLAWIIKEKRLPALCCALTALVVISLYARPDNKIIKKYFGARIRYFDYGNLAGAYLEKSYEKKTEKEQKDELLRKAADNLTKAIPASSPYVRQRYLLRLGEVYYRLGEYDNAKRVFNRVLDLNPNNKRARHYIDIIDSHPDKIIP